MNREFLKNAGVPEDQLDKIMAEYGKDLQAEKDKAKALSTELETYKGKCPHKVKEFLTLRQKKKPTEVSPDDFEEDWIRQRPIFVVQMK